MDKKNPQGDRRQGQQPGQQKPPPFNQPGQQRQGEKEKRDYEEE
jgi:hypothetical protein